MPKKGKGKAKGWQYPAKKRSAPKPRYRRPSVADLAKRMEQRALGEQMALVWLKQRSTAAQVRAIFSVLDARQQNLVVAYEEE